MIRGISMRHLAADVEPAPQQVVTPGAGQLGVELAGQHGSAFDGRHERRRRGRSCAQRPTSGAALQPIGVGEVGMALLEQFAVSCWFDAVPAELRHAHVAA